MDYGLYRKTESGYSLVERSPDDYTYEYVQKTHSNGNYRVKLHGEDHREFNIERGSEPAEYQAPVQQAVPQSAPQVIYIPSQGEQEWSAPKEAKGSSPKDFTKPLLAVITIALLAVIIVKVILPALRENGLFEQRIGALQALKNQPPEKPQPKPVIVPRPVPPKAPTEEDIRLDLLRSYNELTQEIR